MSFNRIEVPKQNDTPFRICMVDITAYLLSHKLQLIFTSIISFRFSVKIYTRETKDTLVLPYGLCGRRGNSSVQGEFLGDP
jgi:hypothetical protein